jgi:hypothetical protein
LLKGEAIARIATVSIYNKRLFMTRSTRAHRRIRTGTAAALIASCGAIVSALTGHGWLAAVLGLAALLAVAYLIVDANELEDARLEESDQ